MRNNWLFRGGRAGAASVAGLALLLALSSCGLEDLEVPPFEGPSTLSLGIRMSATPDIIVADGLSTSLVTATLSARGGGRI